MDEKRAVQAMLDIINAGVQRGLFSDAVSVINAYNALMWLQDKIQGLTPAGQGNG